MIAVIFTIKVMIIKNKWIKEIITLLLTWVVVKTMIIDIIKNIDNNNNDSNSNNNSN